MDLIILTDGLYHLVPVTKQMTEGIELFAKVNCFEICEILRIKLTTYSETINAHMMNDDSGDFFGCICND
tara:strand:- start:165 stop:374 length:210 start_codon:yes stop_codon:yes gene_type:complete